MAWVHRYDIISALGPFPIRKYAQAAYDNIPNITVPG